MKIFEKYTVLSIMALLAFDVDAQNIIPEPAAGKVVKEAKVGETTSLMLSNGMKVIVIPRRDEPDMVYFSIVSPGGTSMYSDADYASAEQAAAIARLGGAGKLDVPALGQFLEGKKVSVNPFIAGRSEGMNCRAAGQDLQVSLELVHAYFTALRKDEVAFRGFIDRVTDAYKVPVRSESELVADSIALIKANGNRRYLLQPSMERLGQIDLDKSIRIFKERFSDAADFTAIFIGDINLETLRPLLEKYLASLPGTHSGEQSRDLGIYAMKQQTDRSFFVNATGDAKVQLYYAGTFKFSKKDELLRELMVSELQKRLAVKLKSVDPGIKNLNLDDNTIKVGVPYYNLSIEFNCSPAKVQQLTSFLQEEIRKLQNETVEPGELDGLKGSRIAKNKTESGDLNFLKQEVLKGLAAPDISGNELLINSITPAELREAARRYLNVKNYSRFVTMPLH